MKNEKIITVFISSTFNDMQAERDYIRKFVLPRLEQDLASANITLQVTDLRWGVDTLSIEESQREATILHVCLDAIRNTRPFFIGLLGGRYGWIPDKDRWTSVLQTLSEDERNFFDGTDGKSVTEMEIVFGAIGNSQVLPHSLFFFRTEESYKDIPNEKLLLYKDDSSLEPSLKVKAEKLKALKQKIEKVCTANDYLDNLFYYTAKWDLEKETFSGLEEFGDKLYDALLREIREEIDQSDIQTSLSAFWREDNALDSFIIEKTRFFKGRQKLLDKLESFLLHQLLVTDTSDETTGYVLTGFSGCGKSAVFGMLCRRLEALEEPKKLVVLSHSAGITPSSCFIEKMLEKWCDKIEKSLNIEHSSANRQYFAQLIVRLRVKGHHPVILIDSLDGFYPDHFFRKFNFIPDNVPCICTALPYAVPSFLIEKKQFKVLNMDCLAEEEARMIIAEVMEKNNKSLSKSLVNHLLAINDERGIPAFNSPLWLLMTLFILLELGEEDFKEMHKEQLEHEDEKIESFLLKVIKAFPADINGLFQQLLHLTYRYFNKELSQGVLSLIALTRFGVNEKELEVILPSQWNSLDFACLQRWLKNFISNNNLDKRWNFSHNKLRESMLQSDSEYMRYIRKKLFDYLIERAKDDNTAFRELIYQCIVYQEYECFNYLIYNRYVRGVNAIVCDWMLTNYEAETLLFIKTFLMEYANNKDNDWLIQIIDKLINNGGRDSTSMRYVQARKLIEIGLKHCGENDLSQGNITLLKNYFALCKCSSDYSDKIDHPVECKQILQEALKIYLINKSKFQSEFLDESYQYTFFYCWNNYIGNLYMQRDKEEFVSAFNLFFEEMLWFYDHLKIDEYSGISIRFHLFNGFIRPFVRYELMSNQQKISYSQRFQEKVMIWKTAITSPWEIDDLAEVTQETLENYVKFFEGKPYISTPLINSIIENDYMMGSTSFFETLDFCHNENNSCEMENTELEDMKEADFSITSYETEAENTGVEEETFSYESSEHEKEEFNIPKEIAETEVLIENYISSFDWTDTEEYIESEEVHKFYIQYMYLVSLYFANNEEQRGLDSMNLLSTLLINKSFCTVEIHAVHKDKMEDLKDLCEQYEKLGYLQEYRSLLEVICCKIYQSFLHHIDQIHLKIPIYKLINFYCDHNLIEEAITFQEKLFELVYRHVVEYGGRLGNSSDLHYASIFYNDLLRSYKKAGKVKEIALLEKRWEKLVPSTDIIKSTKGMKKALSPLPHSLSKNDSVWEIQKWNFVDKDGKLLNENSYNDVGYFSEGLAWVCSGSRNANYGSKGLSFGFLDTTGKLVIPMIYDDATSFCDGKALVCKSSRLFYIDYEGKWIEDF